MLKIYHQASLKKAQKRRLLTSFAAGVTVGTVLVLGSHQVELIPPTHAATVAPTAAVQTPLPNSSPSLSLALSYRLSTP